MVALGTEPTKRQRWKRRVVGLGLVSTLAIPLVDRIGLYIEHKDVLTSGYDTSNVMIAPDSPFERSTLDQLIQGKDIIPGLPEQGAMCAKTMRALVNTLYGESFFKFHRLSSKTVYNIAGKITGKKTLEADAFGIYGDAWEMFQHIQEKGGQLLYFTGDPIGDKVQSNQVVMDQTKAGDIIGFYYPDSQFNTVAKQAGPGFTHMGLVIGHVKKEYASGSTIDVPVIAHLFHSDMYFTARDESSFNRWRKHKLASLYKVPDSTIPALRVEAFDTIYDHLVFNGYVIPRSISQQRTEPEYMLGDQLLYVKAVLRPNYLKGK